MSTVTRDRYYWVEVERAEAFERGEMGPAFVDGQYPDGVDPEGYFFERFVPPREKGDYVEDVEGE
jgi:hypothetical protein